MKATSLLFFSSSPIALPLLEALLKDERFKISGLVCQPDKPSGRGQHLSPPSTKLLATEYGVPVYQPEKLSKDSELLAFFKKDPPDFLLTFAYGQLLSKDWLDLPLREALNVHPSLLPAYRGPTPLQTALLNGETESGLTLMRMVQKMDAGAIATQHGFTLEEMTTGELFDFVAQKAAEWIPDDVFLVASNSTFNFVEQDESKVSLCSMIQKEDAYENFKRSDLEILRRYRAYSPWPGLWTTFEGKRLKLLKLKLADFTLAPQSLATKGSRLFVGSVGQAVELLELQVEGKKPCTAGDFILGHELNGASLAS